MTRLVLLDNEAVQALRTPAHPKHRRALAYVQVVAERKRRAAMIGVQVPTAIRVEAGWDRTSPAWAFANKLRIADAVLDSARSSVAASVKVAAAVSVADAHLGAVIRAHPDTEITVITSDPGDIRRVAGDGHVTVVRI